MNLGFMATISVNFEYIEERWDICVFGIAVYRVCTYESRLGKGG